LVGCVVLAGLGATAAPASAAPGDLTFQGCLSPDTNVLAGGTNACSQVTGVASAGGPESGLDGPQGMAVSPDGTSVYTLAFNDDAIARFSRNASTGVLTYQDCITGEFETGDDGGDANCDASPTDMAGGSDSGLDQPYGLVISPDGASVYVTTINDDSVVHFQRNLSTGALTYQSCFTGETATGNDGGNNSCTAIPSHAVAGNDSGLDKVRAIAIDPNGETVYASGPADDSIARFTRNAMTGALTYAGCLTAEGATGSTGTMACTNLPGITPVGDNSGFDNPQAITVSPNGASLYVASGNDASVTRFGRTAVTGVLTHQECLTRDSGVGLLGCTQLSGSTANGFDSGLDNLRAVVVSSNGASLYVIAGGDASIAHFGRDAGTGALSFQSCITGDLAAGPGGTNACTSQISTATANGDQSGWLMGGIPPALAINAAGTGVFFGTGNDRSVVQLDRNTTTGALTPRRCLTTETESVNSVCSAVTPTGSAGLNTAFNVIGGLALSPDGTSLYTAAISSDAVSRFAFEPAPPAATPPATPKKKCKKGKKLRKGKCVKKKKKKKKK
jgi:6-phosphogluconolactonase (cycloisomerase 2 family)